MAARHFIYQEPKAKIFKSERSLLKPKWLAALASQLIHPLQHSQISLSSGGPPWVVVVVFWGGGGCRVVCERESLIWNRLNLYLAAAFLRC